MDAIIKYLLRMLAYMAAVAPFYIAARAVFVKKRRKKTTIAREIAMLLFAMTATGVASQTLIPEFVITETGITFLKTSFSSNNFIPFNVFYVTFTEVVKNNNIYSLLINFLGNIAVFIPFGIFIPALWRVSAKRTVFIGFLIFFFIELCQLFTPRSTDVDDLWLNALGIFIGTVIFKTVGNLIKRKAAAPEKENS